MAKTKPIGVRFDENVLKRFRAMEINSPQKALNFMEGLFMRTTDDIRKIVVDGIKNKPSKLTVRDISPTGEVKGTYNLGTKKLIESTPKEAYDAPKIENPTHDEPKQYVPVNKPEIDVKAIEQRIKDIQYELAHPPKNPMIGMKKWVGFREDEIKQLQNKLKNNQP